MKSNISSKLRTIEYVFNAILPPQQVSNCFTGFDSIYTPDLNKSP